MILKDGPWHAWFSWNQMNKGGNGAILYLRDNGEKVWITEVVRLNSDIAPGPFGKWDDYIYCGIVTKIEYDRIKYSCNISYSDIEKQKRPLPNLISPKPQHNKCPDCGGSGQYIGLINVSSCSRCSGTGNV